MTVKKKRHGKKPNRALSKSDSKQLEPELEPAAELESAEYELPEAAVELLEKARSNWPQLPAVTDDDCYRPQGREATIARVAANASTQTQVDWSYKDVTEAEAQALLAALSGNTCVRKLDFKGNLNLTDATAQVAMVMLPQCHVLQASFEYCDGMLGEEPRDGVGKSLQVGIRTVLIANVLKAVRTNDAAYTDLDLHDSGLRDDHMEQVADALTHNSNVQSVRLGGNPDLSDVGLRILLARLDECPSVTRIDLSSRRFINKTLTDEGVVGLLLAIPTCAVVDVNIQFCDNVSWELETAITAAIEARTQQEKADRRAEEAAAAERLQLAEICPDCEPGGKGERCEPHERARKKAKEEADQAAAEAALAEARDAEARRAAVEDALAKVQVEARAAVTAAEKKENDALVAQERARQQLAEVDAMEEKLDEEEAVVLAARARVEKLRTEVEAAEAALRAAKKSKKGQAKKKKVVETTAALKRKLAEVNEASEYVEGKREEVEATKLKVERVSP